MGRMTGSNKFPNNFINPLRTIENVVERIPALNGSESPISVSERVDAKRKREHDGGSRGAKGNGSGSASRGSHNPKAPLYIAICSYVSYLFILVTSWMKELAFGIGPTNKESRKRFREVDRDGYAPLYGSFENFYVRNVYRRLKNVLNVPIASVPGSKVRCIDRTSDDHYWTMELKEDSTRECINLASYNYLGFAENRGSCTDAAVESCHSHGLASCSPVRELGHRALQKELEETVARFVGTEDAVTFGMGFATNTMNIPSLLSKDCLVVSDEFNHASLILGLRLSGATVKVFKHNDVANLERVLRSSIVSGRTRTHIPWKKILIVVEGIYSMEGSICPLPEIVALKKKYGAYLYLDEAHSIGAMGPNGRGIVDYYGLDPTDVDVLMGTFTKSFAAAGGYIAGSKKMVDHVRTTSHANVYACSMSPPVMAQIITSMQVIMDPDNPDGRERIARLSSNSQYFRKALKEKGFVVYGSDDSPVIPLLTFMPSKIAAFVASCLGRGVAVTGVGFPATKMTEERIRFCMSAGHTKEMLDQALEVIDKVGDETVCKYVARFPSASRA